jgi:hypothetical protein
MTPTAPPAHRDPVPEKRKDPVARALSFELNLIDPKVNLFCSSGEHPNDGKRQVKDV